MQHGVVSGKRPDYFLTTNELQQSSLGRGLKIQSQLGNVLKIKAKIEV